MVALFEAGFHIKISEIWRGKEKASDSRQRLNYDSARKATCVPSLTWDREEECVCVCVRVCIIVGC